MKEATKKTTITFTELNVLNLPLFDFSKKPDDTGVKLVKRWQETRAGKKIDRCIEIMPSQNYGMLNAFDYLILQSIFLYIRQHDLLPVPERITFMPVDIENSLKEIQKGSGKTNRLQRIKNSIFKMAETDFYLDNHIYSKSDDVRREERKFRLISEIYWQGQSKVGRKSSIEYCEIVLPTFLRDNINNNLVMLFNLNTMKQLDTGLTKKSYQYLFWTFYRIFKLKRIGSFPIDQKEIIYRRKYSDFITLFLLKKQFSKYKVERQIDSVLKELKEKNILTDYKIEKGKDDYILVVRSGEKFVNDYKTVNLSIKGQQEFDFTDDVIPFNEEEEEGKQLQTIEKLKKYDKGLYRKIRLSVNYRIRRSEFFKMFGKGAVYDNIVSSLICEEVSKRGLDLKDV